MKKLLIAIVLLVLVVITALWLAYRNLDRIVVALKPDLERALSDAVGRRVTFGKASVSIFPGAQIQIRELRIDEKGGEDLRVEQANLSVELMPLFDRKVSVTKLTLLGPTVTIVQAGGEPSSLGTPGREKTKAGPAEGGSSSINKEVSRGASSPIQITLQRFEIRDGSVVLQKSSGVQNLARGLVAEGSVDLGESGIRISNLSLGAKVLEEFDLALSIPGGSYEPLTGQVNLRPSKLASGPLTLSVEGDYNLTKTAGKFLISSNRIASGDIRALAGSRLPAAFTFIQGGNVSTSATIEIVGGEIKTTGTMLPENVSGAAFDLAFSGGKGKVRYKLAGGDVEVQSDDLSFVIGKATTVLAAINFDKGGLEASIRSDFLRVRDFESILKKMAPAAISYKPDAEIKPDLKLRFGPGSAYRATGALVVRNGSFEYEGRAFSNVSGPITLDFSPDNAVLKTQGISLSIKDAGAVKFSGEIYPLSGKGDIRLRSEGGIELARAPVPGIQGFSPRGSVRPDIRVKLSGKGSRALVSGALSVSGGSVTSGKHTLSGIDGQIDIVTDDRGAYLFESKNLAARYGQEDLMLVLRTALTDKSFYISDFGLKGFGGNLKGKAKMSLEGLKQFESDLVINAISLPRFIAAFDPEGSYNLEGQLKTLSLRLTGAMRDNLLASLAGSGNLEIEKGVLKGINIGREVLTRVDRIPFLEGTLYRKIPQEFYPYFEKEDTPIKHLSADITVRDQTIVAENLRLLSDLFGALGNGRFGFDSRMSVKTSIYFDEEFSRKFVGKVNEVRRLLNKEGLLMIPIAANGKLPDIRVLPDIDALLKNSAGRFVEEEIGNVLDGFLRRQFGEKKPAEATGN